MAHESFTEIPGPKTKHDEPPVSLDTGTLPELPLEIFPGWLGTMIEAVSRATETPRELPAMLAQAVLGTCCQKVFLISPARGYFEPLNIWSLVALESGNRKSAVLQHMTKPLFDWEHEQLKNIQSEIPRVESERETMEARIRYLRGKAVKVKPEEFGQIEAEIRQLETSMPQVPSVRRWWAQDITPEKLGQVMAENDESLAILSDEGGVFDIMAGRYNSGIPNLDIFLQAHAGTPVRVDRGSRAPVDMQHPALTIGLSPQPDVLRSLISKPGFRGRGLLARFLYMLPPSKLGYRTLDTEPVPEVVTADYRAGIRALLGVQPSIDERGDPQPFILRPSREALSEWRAFAEITEREMREGQRFEHVTDWAGKLPGAALRLAGQLHCAEHAHGQPSAVSVSKDTMDRALAFAAVLADHALAAFDLMGADPALDAARRVWRWIERNRKTSFSARDAFDALKRHFKRMANFEPAVGVLLERSYIFEQEHRANRGPGRPSRVFRVNSHMTERWQ